MPRSIRAGRVLFASLLGTTLALSAAGALAQAPANRPPDIRQPTAQEQRELDALQKTMGTALSGRDWPTAAKALERITAIHEVSWGREHPSTLMTLETWALAVQLSGDGVRAEQLFRRALEVRTRTGGARHPQLAMINNGIGQALDLQGKPAEAEPYYRKALELRVALHGPESRDAALAYNNLAINLAQAGKIAEAETLFRKALAISIRIEGEDSETVATSRANFAAILANGGRYAQAETEHRKALAIREKTLGPAHPDVAASHNGLGVALMRQGRLAEAEPLFRKALEIRRKALGGKSPATAESLGNLGTLVQTRGKAAEAEPMLREALAIWREISGPDHPNTLIAENNLATCLIDQARFADAEPLLRHAYEARLRVLGEAHPEVAVSLNNLAGLLERDGREIEAEALYRKALATTRTALGENHDMTATGYNNLAHNVAAQGRLAEAEALHRKALEIRVKALGEDHPDTADSESNLGYVLDAQRRFAEARPFFEKALASNRKRDGATSLRVASSLNNLAANLDNRGRRDETAPLYQQAYDIRLKALGADHPLTALSQNNVAYSLYRRGKRTEAIALYRRTLASFRKTLGNRNPGMVVPLGNLAMILVEDPAKDGPEALTLAREASAIADARRAAITSGRAAGGDGAAQAALRARGASALSDDPLVTSYIALTQVNWAIAGRDAATADAMRAEAFVAAQAIDISKAGQAMARTAARTAAGAGPLGTLVGRQQRLADRLVSLEAAYADAVARGDRTAADRAATDSSAAATELAGVDAEIASRFPDYQRLITPQALSIAEVQKRLDADEGLLFIQPSNGDMFSFAVTRDRIAWHRAPQRQLPMNREIETLICQVDSIACQPEKRLPPKPVTPFEEDGYGAFDRASAHALYRDLVAPVEAALAGTKRLYVTTSGALSRLPLGLLVTAAPEAADDADPAVLAATPWLADRYAITVLPAISTLKARDAARTATARTGFRGYGAPRFREGQGDARARGLRAPVRAVFDSAPVNGIAIANPEALRELAPLPGTRTELMAMARALKAPASAVRLDTAATEGALRGDSALSGARVIAFATHGLLPNEVRGLNEPGLVFTPPAKPSPQDDGLLTASEAASLRLSADWVILSACNTASAESGGDSLSSLSRAFLYAGARSLLATHWRVSDEATAVLTVETLSSPGNERRSAALQRAMRAIRDGKRADGSPIDGWQSAWAHPAFWAPFSVIADRDD